MTSRIAWLASLIVTLVASSTFAAGVAEPLIGNTLTVQRSNEAPVVLTFAADGTYTRNGAAGKWEEKDGLICMTADADGETHCEPLDGGHAPGDTWQQQSADGSGVTMTLSAGQ